MILTIARPRRDYEGDYDSASATRRSATKILLKAAREKVFTAYKSYDATGGNIGQISAMQCDADTVGALKSNYSLTYSGRPLAEIRDEAFCASRFGLCPMCGRGQVSTLDHYLPREKYPEFSLLSLNLVPACDNCNRYKSRLVGSSTTGRFLHVYYDTLPSDIPLLRTNVTANSGVAVEFVVNDNLPGDVYLNVRYHFEQLRLGGQYSKASALELLERYELFVEAHKDGGPSEVSRAAKYEARRFQRKLGPHYWKAALYDGVAMSVDFCSGGFEYFAPTVPAYVLR